jgi:hypothetical protein
MQAFLPLRADPLSDDAVPDRIFLPPVADPQASTMIKRLTA